MPSGLVIPSSLKYSLYRMIQDASISTNVLRLIPLNVQSAQGGGLISVRLPLATCSLPSFSMSFNNSISAAAGYSSASNSSYPGTSPNVANSASFPKGLESLIQRLEIVVAGVSLMTLPNYNMLYQTLKDINMTLDHSLSRHIVEGEDTVAPILDQGSNLGQNSRNTQFITFNQWSVSSASTAAAGNLVIYASTDHLPSADINGYYLLNPPPSSFFGYTTTGTCSQPVIGSVDPGSYFSDGYSVGPGYCMLLTYASDAAWTAAGGTVGLLVNKPFTVGISDVAGALIDTLSSNTQYNTIRDFLGFFKAMPKAIQLAALGEVEVRIYLEQPQNCLTTIAPAQTIANLGAAASSQCKQTSSPQYKLENIEFQIRTMSWDNGWLDSMMQAQLAEGNTLEIPYPNYYSVVQNQASSGQSTTRFSVNTQNLRQVWSINRNQYYTDAIQNQQLMIPAGMGIDQHNDLNIVYKGSFFATSASNPSAYMTPNSRHNASSNYSTFSNQVSNKWQYLINNQLIPNLQVPPQRTYAFTQELLGKEDWQEGTCVGTPFIYMSGCYSMGITLEYIDKYCDASVRELFGLDTRSASSVFYLNQTNNAAGDTTYVFSLFTSVLRVAMNNQIQVVI